MFKYFYTTSLLMTHWLVASSKVGVANRVAIVNQVGVANLKARPYIAGGSVANRDEFTHLGVVAENGENVCAGSVITENLILTAAHCFYQYNSSKFVDPEQFSFLHGGIVQKVTNGKILHARHNISVSRLIPHQNYLRKKDSYDIGLMVLRTRLDFRTTHSDISRVSLYRHDFDATEIKCQIAGWGFVSLNPVRRYPTLHKASLYVKPKAVCLKHEPVYEHRKMLCAMGKEVDDNHQKGCGLYGDSGTSLICPNPKSKSNHPQRRFSQLGILVYYFNSSRMNYFIRVPKFIPWIEQYAMRYSKSKLRLVNYESKDRGSNCCIQ